jgi:hypothetical protein
MSSDLRLVSESTGTTKSLRCPCCKFKTLRGRGGFDVCPVCYWEDDGQDEPDAEKVLGGPNGLLVSDKRRPISNNSELLGVASSRWSGNRCQKKVRY